jgi:predicted secreted hydrolase
MFFAVVAVALTACQGSPTAVAPRSIPVERSADAVAPQLPPISLPRDDAPHSDLTEWWYYTGHLETRSGDAFGVEFVVFQSTRGTGPVGYAAHYAVTDLGRGTFHYAEKTSVGSQIGTTDGFALRVADWSLVGGNGRDRIVAAMADYQIDLTLQSIRPAVLHQGTGIISFGPAGDSYYYSRPRMRAEGTLTIRGQSEPVTGLVWMDHQWGNFISGGGGWDWLSLHLGDGSDLSGSVVRSDDGSIVLAYATYIDPTGRVTHVPGAAMQFESSGTWQSPQTGATYPARWRVRVSDPAIDLQIRTRVADQELDTRGSTGVVYWEGAVDADGTVATRPVAGRGYVELTGYRPSR